MSARGTSTESARPPVLARWLISRLCPAEDRAFVVSDLAEELETRTA